MRKPGLKSRATCLRIRIDANKITKHIESIATTPKTLLLNKYADKAEIVSETKDAIATVGRFAIEYEHQLGPKFSHSAISNIKSYRKEQLASGAYNRDLNRPDA